jgi:hypothetical protein
MFSKKRASIAELDVSDCADILRNSREFLRMWQSSGDGPTTCFIDPANLGDDPFMLGIALTDCVRHGAKAYARAAGISEADAEKRIWAGLDAERSSPTDAPTDLSETRKPN